MSIAALKEWNDFVDVFAGPYPRGIRAESLQKRLISALTATNVSAMVTLYSTTRSRAKERAALRILALLHTQKDSRFLAGDRERWRAALARRVKAGYPHVSGWYQWRDLDPEAARDFIVRFERSALAEEHARRYIEHLSSTAVPTAPEALTRLRALAKGRSAAAAAARAELRKRRGPSTSVVARRARAWRKGKRVQQLAWLYYNYIGGLPEGTPIRPVLELLGPPDESLRSVTGHHQYIWRTEETLT